MGTPSEGDPPAELAVGSSLGRYQVRGYLGAGGMGRVFSAYDAELDRQVALKVLHAGAEPAGSKIEEFTVRLDAAGEERNLERERILAEARAMARLSHPNLIAVFEVGEVDDRVFLAMEHVAGVTLTEWLAARPRSTPQVLRLFVEIGRGLAAAHAAGLVHGDVKPSNVLVEPSGRARVIDFGLARTVAVSLGGKEPVMGTPRYIAPERLAHRRADARADQYAFAVMLEDALRRAPADGPRRARVPRVPRYLARLLARARATEPSDRFPSMEALLKELQRLRRRRSRMIGTGLISAAVGAALLIGRTSGDAVARCDGGAARLAGVWDPSVDAEVKAALHGVGQSYADAAYERVSTQLHRYRDDWVALYRQACEATAGGTQSSEMLDRKMACLDRRLAGLRQTTTLLRHSEAISRASSMVAALPPLAACRDADALLAVVPLPEDPVKRAAVAEVDRAVAAAEIDRQAGHIEASLRAGQAALERAQAIGHAPLSGRAGALIGRALADSGRPADAEAALLDALDAAVRGRDDALVASIEVELVGVIGLQQNRVEEARLLGRLTGAALSRAGAATDAVERPRLLARLGAIAGEHEEFAAAEKLLVETGVLMRANLPEDDPRIARAEDLLASVYLRAGRYEDALTHYQIALSISERALGPDHPQVADILNNVAVAYSKLRRPEPAAMYRRALSIVEKLPEYTSTPALLNNLGALEFDDGRFELALQYHQRALDLRRARLGPSHPDVARSLNSIAAVYLETGNAPRALELARQALPLYEAAYGPNHERVANTLALIGEVLRRSGRAKEAVPLVHRAVAIIEKSFGEDQIDTRWVRAYAALSALDASPTAQTRQHAIAAIERYVADLQPGVPDRVPLLFGLARAKTPSTRRASEATLAAVREAREIAVTRRPLAVAEIDRWLAAHAP
ncbi:MAG: serine/threonine-protein kinase [Kofleriaceae bacterium]